MSLFGQDVDTFTSTMLLNVDQLQNQLDKDEFQEDGSMTAFWVVNNKFQKFIDSQFTLDYDNQMTDKYFVEYTRIDVKHFKDTLLHHMGNVKKSFAERTCHQRRYDRWVNKRRMQTQEIKIDTGNAVDADLVITESSGIESEVQDDSNRSGNDIDTDDADIRPIYDEEPMAEVQLTTECNIFATGQQHTEQPEIINEGRVDQYIEQCQVKSPMLDSSPDNQTTEYSKQSLENGSKNMPRFSSNDMVHNHYLDEARKKTQERDRNSKTSVMPSARFQSTADGSKPKPRESTSINVQKEQSLDLSTGTLCNVNKENLRVWLLKKVDISETIVKVIHRCDTEKLTFDHNRSSLEPQCQMKFEQNGSSSHHSAQKFIQVDDDSNNVKCAGLLFGLCSTNISMEKISQLF
ncbi:hypothetical protein Tco_0650775 [Tanacetum coccineum]